jgi:hypothetical protein
VLLKIHYIVDIILGPRTGVNLKSRNVLILCCENSPFAKTSRLQALQRSIIRLVLVGFNVAMLPQNRQCTVRSHDSITDNYYDIIYHCSAIYIAPREYRGIVWLRWIYDDV